MLKNRPGLSVSASKISEASFKIASDSNKRNAFVQNPQEVLGQFGIELNIPEIKHEDGVVCTSEICTPPVVVCFLGFVGVAVVALLALAYHTAAAVMLYYAWLHTDTEVSGYNMNTPMSNHAFYNFA